MSDDRVLDASAAVMALAGKTEAADDLRERLGGWRLHAPHLYDAEVGNVLRRHLLRGLISPREADEALVAGGVIVEYRYPHRGPLAELAWRWRDNLSFYDALYVALAVSLDVPLVTADSRLANAPALACAVELAGV